MSNTNEFQWTDELIKEMMWSKLPIPMHYAGDVQKCLDEFKKSKEVSRDYEILSFKDIKNEKVLTKRLIDNIFEMFTANGYHEFWEKDFFESPIKDRFKINSVRRLSDGEVFTLGDKVFIDKKDEPTNWIGEIIDFWIDGNGKMHICYNGHHYKIKYFKKAVVKKEPLFTTYDGKEIFEGDRYWAINTDCNSKPIEYTALHFKNYMPNLRYFSTEDAAKEYVLKNKPFSISYHDLMNRLHAYFKNPVMASENILHLAKEKLNQ